MSTARLCLGIFLVMVLGSMMFSPPKLFLWNKTESAKTGLYVRVPAPFLRDDFVAVMPDAMTRKFISERQYLPPEIPLLKQIKAMEGDLICRYGDKIFINNIAVATALKVDSFGRNMPRWRGCFMLKKDEFFLLNEHEKSLDGRYFQRTKKDQITGKYRHISRYFSDPTGSKSGKSGTEIESAP